MNMTAHAAPAIADPATKRLVSIGRALRKLEPGLLDLDRMAVLGHCIAMDVPNTNTPDGNVSVPVELLEAMQFALCDLRERTRALRAQWDRALADAEGIGD